MQKLTKLDLIACDIDGTLLTYDGLANPYITEIKKLIAQHKIPLTLASGRSLDGLQKVAEALGVTEFPLVGDNGSMLYKSARCPEIIHENLLFEPLEQALAKKLTAIYGNHLENLCLANTLAKYAPTNGLSLSPEFNDVNTLKAIYVFKTLLFASQAKIAVSYAANHREHLFVPHEIWQHEYLLQDLNSTYVPHDFISFSQMSVYKIFMLTNLANEIVEPVFDQFCAWLNVLKDELNVIRYGSYSLDIMTNNIDKKAGLKYLKEHTQYKHIAAIGDSLNDIGMMEVADISGCVANARPELKAVCSFVASKPFAEGVLEFLRYLLGQQLI